MPRFFTDCLDKNNIKITGNDAHHIGRSLRMKLGDSVTLCCKGIDYNCSIASISNEEVQLNLIEAVPCESEPDINVTLYQAVPKLDKLEYIIQKSVELGVSRIVPFISKRCVSRPDSKDFSKKLVRLNKISEEASKQSGRGIIPEVMPIINYKKALEDMSLQDKIIILYENGGKSFSEIDFKDLKNIGIVIGSEGGFEKEEVESVLNIKNADSVWLGKRILRCETAPITALSILMFLTDNM
ncbi:MAG: 16S rRNA (uracil(1498)-N(3))-methyltransferase [Oscillospiraceae bacterium]|nr:16S rRNA (uracil(1498)-N(3))-methyltransferase [Oscillospiraceae bacterium]